MSARSLNKALLIGNMTRDPELRYTGTGTPVATFGIATNKSWKDANGETKELTEFHNIVSWNKMAEICQQLLAKGMKVYIEGSLTTRSWEDESGVTKYKTEVRVDDMILLDSKGRRGAGMDDVSDVPNTGPASEAPVDKKEVKDEKPAKKTAKKAEKETDEDPLDEDLPF